MERRASIIKFLPLLVGMFFIGSYCLLGQNTPRVIENFTLNDEHNKPITLSQFSGSKALVVIFTSANCSWASSYEERINQLHQDYQSRGIAFLAINSNDATMSLRDDSRTMRTHQSFSFSYVKDSKQMVARQLGATKNPEFFVLQPTQGKYAIVYQGKMDDNPLNVSLVREPYLRNALDQILSGQKVKQPRTDPQGCNIRWLETAKR
ncbi:MAG: thioredoxin family protein [Bacteroidota bacterium]